MRFQLVDDIKPSWAIREGAKLRPQIKNFYFGVNDQGEECSCAIGAAYEAIYGINKEPSTFMGNKLPNIFETYISVDQHPIEGSIGLTLPSIVEDTKVLPLADTITLLNDCHEWTREEIADWLEFIGL